MKKDIQIIVKFTKLIKASHPVVRERVHFLSLAKSAAAIQHFPFFDSTTSSLFNVLVL